MKTRLDDMSPPSRVVSIRALLVGGAAVTALALVSIHCTLGLVGSLMSWDLVLETSVFLLTVVMLLNSLVRRVWSRAALGRGEMVTVFLMILAAAPVPTIGYLARVIPALGGLTYYATEENRWASLAHPFVPKWLAPRDTEAVRWLFDGLPRGEALPWSVWVVPLGFWAVFFLLFSFCSICLAVMLRRQWIERERLAYPIVGVATSLLDAGQNPSEPPLWRRPLFWIGLGVAVGFSSLWPIRRYVEEIWGWRFEPPSLDDTWFSQDRLFAVRFKISWAILGLTYLIPLDVSLSLWFFNLLYQLQYGYYKMLGCDERLYPEYGVVGGPAYSGQALGAFLFIGLSSLWLGRRHLATMWRAAWRRGGYDDSEEILSCRWTVWGFVASFILVVVCLRLMGTPLPLAVLVLVLALLSLIALTKIAIHCGLGWMDTPFPATSIAANISGTQVMSNATVMSLASNYIWTYPMRIVELGTVSHGLKVAEPLRASRRGLFWAVIAAVVLALVAGSVFQLLFAYGHGGVNFYGWFYRSYAAQPWAYAVEKVRVPHGPRWAVLAWTTVGTSAAGLMQFLRHRYLAFPFSVVGYAGAFIPTTQKFWFDIFLVWAVKGLLLRYGGVRLYLRFRPVFLGLILGHAAACGVWYIAYLFSGINGGVPW